jgi:mannose-6-phosphate isomerase-like protein (cupin superfamily)
VAGYKIFRGDELEFAQPSGGNQERGIVRLSDAMQNMRANIWRMPPGVRGRRHRELVQEEVFVVLEGTATLRLGDPAEPVELPQGSVVVAAPQTAVQLTNEADEETVVLIVGAPPVQGEAEYLPDLG